MADRGSNKPSRPRAAAESGIKRIQTFEDVLERSGGAPESGLQADKKNYAERFSRNSSTWIANGLRAWFPGVTPNLDGSAQEVPARTGRGFKKLDVGYSTPQLGLALGVSVKSIHTPDPRTGRFTKNYSRNDNELRAEATDYHKRQPYAVLAGVLFLPEASCVDGGTGAGDEAGVSSFGKAVQYFKHRADRRVPAHDPELFERFFVALYSRDPVSVKFFDVMRAPPKNRMLRADEGLTFEQFVDEIRMTYDQRNKVGITWAE
jgi:hypothetical protein